MGEHHFAEAAFENIEAVVDALTDNDIVKSIPVVGTIVKLWKGASDTRDKIFAEKLWRFVQTFDKTTTEQREKRRRKIAANPDEARKVGETLVLVLDKITALDKAPILAYVFSAYIEGHITPTDFRRLADAIDQAFVDDLKEFLGARKSGHSNTAEYMKHLTRTGLTFADPTMIPRPPEDYYYKVSRLGKQLNDAYSEGIKYCRGQ